MTGRCLSPKTYPYLGIFFGVAYEILPGDQEGKEPAEGSSDRWGYGLHLDGEQLAHDGPGQGAQAHAVSDDEHHQRQDRQEADGVHSWTIKVVQEEVHAQESLEIKQG